MLKFIKNWTLPIAMCAGVLGFPVFIRLTFLTPILIFVMLLLTFSKITLRELRPTALHIWLLVMQLSGALLLYFSLCGVNEVLAQAAMLCVICPTATSASVITAKLGGSAASVTTYTLLVNVGVAIVVPVMFPFIEPHPEANFWDAFSVILGRVFVLLICPFLLSMLLRSGFQKAHKMLLSLHELAFYLWAFALAIVTSQILFSLLSYSEDVVVGVLIAAVTLVICGLQFFVGKTLGSRYDDRIAGGQSLGQKNTILAIWMAHAYLNPLSAIGPGFYVIWQNIVNSWQLWRKQKKNI